MARYRLWYTIYTRKEKERRTKEKGRRGRKVEKCHRLERDRMID